ncbi:jg10410 [Pararge aegeria aegeria]|uniref:Jg10410 protein n=1 Tax=Pararge aegeria aegeria TaxID=348720 RepID=A0A8S4RMS0_9NEOP|nr:jg10410 [Pararge aegeria aegeria]
MLLGDRNTHSSNGPPDELFHKKRKVWATSWQVAPGVLVMRRRMLSAPLPVPPPPAHLPHPRARPVINSMYNVKFISAEQCKVITDQMTWGILAMPPEPVCSASGAPPLLPTVCAQQYL